MAVNDFCIQLFLLTAAYYFLVTSRTKNSVCEAACVQQSEGEADCPKSCTCTPDSNLDGHGVNIDCSNGGFTNIPDVPEDTVALLFDENKLQSIRDDDFKGCLALKYLSLTHNGLETIYKSSFKDLVSLEELHLNDNQLSFNLTSGKLLFGPLQRLKVLTIHNNFHIEDEILENLTALEALTLDRFTKTLNFKSFFLNFYKLAKLELYGSFKKIPNDTFRYFQKSPLRELKLLALGDDHQSSITDIQALAFANLTHLEILDLSNNRGVGFGNASQAMYGLCGSAPLTTLLLSRIVLKTETATHIPENFYKYLPDCTNLTKLCLDKNNIVAVEVGFARAVPHLEYLDFSYNHMSNVLSVFGELIQMKKLRYLDISYQTYRYVTYHGPQIQKRSIKVINDNVYFNSYITRSDTDLRPLKQHERFPPKGVKKFNTCLGKFKPCQYPSIFYHSKSNKSVPMPEDGTWCLPLPEQLEIFKASSSLNEETTRLPVVVLLPGHNSKLSHLIYRSNGVSQMTGPLLIARSYQSPPLSFDAGDNGISCIAPNLLKRSKTIGPNIGELILDRNNLGDQLAEDKSGSVFKQFKEENTTVLNLASNYIKTLPKSIFIHVASLQELNLSSNSLWLIDFSFIHMKQLRKLDLSYNLISKLNEPVLGYLKELFVANNLTLYLSGNPTQCSCETVKFLTWVERNQANIENFKQISCFVDNVQLTFNQLSTDILPQLRFQCATNLILKLSVALLGCTVFVIGLSVFLYRHRWDIRYWLLSFRSKVPHREEVYEYQAFVSHDHRDMPFVLELVKMLENTFGSHDQSCSSAFSNSTNITFSENEESKISEISEGSALLVRSASPELLTLDNTSHENFNLCVSQRDFAAGAGIEENILRAIGNSRKVIVVLSKSFLRSKWCNFELEMSRVESVNRGYNILVPVMLEPLDIEDMSSCLKWLVRQYTYLEWSEDEVDGEEFWKNLVRVLQKPGKEFWEVHDS